MTATTTARPHRRNRLALFLAAAALLVGVSGACDDKPPMGWPGKDSPPSWWGA